MESTPELEIIKQPVQEVFSVHSELKKLTHIERLQLLNNIRIEEAKEKEEKIIKQKQEQELVKEQSYEQSQDNSNMTTCGREMSKHYQAIFSELRGLRLQVKQLQTEMHYLNNNNNNNNHNHNHNHNSQQNTQLQTETHNLEEYDSSNSCSFITLISEWMPFWIFIVFFLFALTGKPKVCSVSGISSGIGSCPITGLSDMFTKM